MYTFAIAAVLSFILAGAIFGKRIKQHQMTVAMIVFAGTLLASVIVNGVVGKNIPYSLVKIKTKTLKTDHSIVRIDKDTIFDEYAHIQYLYIVKVKKNGDTATVHYIDIGSFNDFYPGKTSYRELFIELLPEEDSTTSAYVDVYRHKKIPNSRWVSKMGLPMAGREFHIYLENNPKHRFLLEQINERFYGIEPDPITLVCTDSIENIGIVVYEN